MQADVAIVGSGPHATYALDRLSAVCARGAKRSMKILVFERTGKFGDGAVHDASQPSTSYMNRSCGDIALGADRSNSSASIYGPGHDSFINWLHRNGFDSNGAPAMRPVDPAETPIRALHGAALAAAFRSYLDRLADSGHSAHLVAREVVDVEDDATSGCLCLIDASGDRYHARHILLATGHGQPRRDDRDVALEDALAGKYLDWPYPLKRISAMGNLSAESVCIDGLGLSAIDVLLYLTEGQGGRFEKTRSGRLVYHPSGREPGYITGISSTGLLVSTRPRNEKAALGYRHRGVVLTQDTVSELQRKRGQPVCLLDGRQRSQIDFERDLLPIIILEMSLVYYATGLGQRNTAQLNNLGKEAAGIFLSMRAQDEALSEWHVLVDELLNPIWRLASTLSENEPFEWRSVLFGALDGADWHTIASKAAESDLAEARRGNLSSPLKGAIDGVWRDLRPLLQTVLDFGGLTARSEAIFQGRYLRVYNRLSNGASVESMEKVLCLARSGHFDLSHGPGASLDIMSDGGVFVRGANPREVSVVIRGRLARFSPQLERSPLYRNMLGASLLRQWVNPGSRGTAEFRSGAIAISSNHYALRPDGSEDRRLMLIGTPIDGVRYFQESAARPSANSDAINRLASWAEEVAASIHATSDCA